MAQQIALALRRRASALKARMRFELALRRMPDAAPTSKIQLAVITGELEVGGVGRVLLNIIKDLPRDRYDITIFTTDPRLNNWAPEFAKHVSAIVDIPLLIGRTLPQERVQQYLAHYLARQRADIIFITNSVAGYHALSAIKTTGASARAAVFDLIHTHGRPQDNDAFLKISHPFDAYITKRIVISNYLRDYFCTKYDVNPDKVRVLYNGVDTAVLQSNPDQTHGRAILGLQDETQAISYVGRLQSDKSPGRLIELAARLEPLLSKTHTHIAIVGEGELEPELRARASELGVLDTQVRFYPFTDTPLDVFAASKFTIITSDLEGIPMSALESMYAHAPVIAPAVGGLPEIISDGSDGFLASFADPDENTRLANLSAAIERALSLDDTAYSAMQQAAHQKILDRFSTMGSQYLELFDSSQS